MTLIDLFDDAKIGRTSVEFVLSQKARAGGLLLENLILDYEDSISDLRDLPLEVLQLPALLNVAPVVWYAGGEVSVPFTDPLLEQGLERIRAHFKKMYPEEAWEGRLRFEGPPIPPSPTGGKSGMMFSGGLDSVMSLVLHADKPLVLITVAGADVRTEEAWAKVRRSVTDVASAFGAENAFVRANIRSFLNYRRLSNIEPLLKHGIQWWGGAQHGLAFVGLSAPIAWSRGIDRLYFASTHTESFAVPWGSGPAIDNHIKWRGFEVVHDGYDMTRQNKIRAIIAYCEQHGVARPVVRVCTSRFTDHSSNCGRCEKCLRTIAGLLVEDEDCRPWGFEVDAAEALKRTEAAFASQRINMRDDELFMWNDIRDRALARPEGSSPLADWIRRYDFDAYRQRCVVAQQRQGRLKSALARVPFLYEAARRARHAGLTLRNKVRP